MMWPVLRGILFQLEAERAHHLLSQTLRLLPSSVLDALSGGIVRAPHTLRGEFGSLAFLNRVGLAAGFDKDALLLRQLPHLGFGFAEVGTVTLKPQSGNPQPRLFRDLSDESLLNRMGFNNAGVEAMARRLDEARPRLPSEFRIGVNVGKNKDSDLSDAPKEYRAVVRRLRDLGDYFVINVSSPNTPGLRGLQDPESLAPLIQEVRQVLSSRTPEPPLFVKLSPEVAAHAGEWVGELEKLGLAGWVVSNTLGSDHGGWSGGRVRGPARSALTQIRSQSKRVLISSGGIDGENEAFLRIRGGAELIQIYTGWVYGGPKLPGRIARALSAF